jgi:hypothetical protein
VDGRDHTFVTWSTSSIENERVTAIHLAVLDDEGSVVSNRQIVAGTLLEPDLFTVGDHLGLAWVRIRGGVYDLQFDWIDAQQTRSRLPEPITVFSHPGKLLGRPAGIMVPLEEDAPMGIVLDWLASTRGGPDAGSDQDIMRAVLLADGDGWRVSPASTVRATDSNIVEHGWARAGDRMVSLHVDNGVGGPMCHGLCSSALANDCVMEPTDRAVAACRPNCHHREGLVFPSLLACIAEVSCDDADFLVRANLCEDGFLEIPPPEFASVGVHVHVTTTCQAF